MANGIRTGDPRGFNKGRSSKFCVGSRVRQTPEEYRRIYRPKRCGNNNEDEDNSSKILNDKKNDLFIDLTRTGTTTPGQSRLESNGNKGVLHIPQISKTGVSPSDAV